MNSRPAFRHLSLFLLLVVAFIVSVIAVSNLMPLLLLAATKRLGIIGDLLIVVNLFAGIMSFAFLARAMYRLDKRAGRIRNRVDWFE